MKNRLIDLNNHLFAQIERLSQEGLTPEQIEVEAARGAAIVSISDQIIRTADTQLRAVKLWAESGDRVHRHLTMIGGLDKGGAS